MKVEIRKIVNGREFKASFETEMFAVCMFLGIYKYYLGAVIP